MELIFALFWLGLLIAAASFVFAIGLTVIMFVIGGIFSVVAWVFEKITGKSNDNM